ncbi:MAG: hypothetical protein M3R14_16650 [Acidobacteriota bacterium]|nr:hypothetical protein [Acidobacteriota bacterium]
MNCNVEVEKSSGAPVLAGTFRFLMGLALMFVGLHIAILSDIQGYGLGLLLVFGSPFVIFKDDK